MMSIKDWTQIKVKEICDIGRGRVISSQEIESRLGIYPVFSSQSQNRGEMGRIDTYDFDGEYVTWTTDGAYAGTVFYREGKFNCTNVCGTLKANSPQISMEFLAYKLSTLAKNYVSYVGNPKLMNNVMANIELSLPDNKKEQEQIADVLSTIDRAIAQTEAIIAKQQRIKTGLMQDLLTKGIDENGNIRSEATHEFKDSAIGRIPEEWNMSSLAECSHRVVVGLASSTTHAYRDVGIPMIRNQNIRKGYFDDRDILYLDANFVALFPNKATQERDVITVRTGANVGDTAIVPKKYVGSPTFTTLITSTKKDILLPEYLVWYVESQLGKSELNRILVGGGKENLNVGQLIKFRVTLPPIEEQKLVVKHLQVIQSQLIEEQITLAKRKKVKTGLMQGLLTGKVRVTNLLKEKEPTIP
jgi:type I restriction enzyme, S subunit